MTKNAKKTIGISVCIFLLNIGTANSQEVQRPAIWGIAKMTMLASSFDMVKDYYGRFLGFDQAFSYQSDKGKVVSYKVNDRQFLEFVEDSKAGEKDRLVSVSFETENVEQMRQYLKSKGQIVPDKTIIDGAGNEVFTVKDPSGNNIEFMNFGKNGLHKRSKGKYLSDNRIARRIHHAGFYAKAISEDDPFYVQILNFKPIIRIPEDPKVPAGMLYLAMDECIENIEYYAPSTPNSFHPCLLVEDMQETIYTLKERRISETVGKPIIGKSRRWIMNIANTDGTKVEFTEAHCAK